MRQNSRGDDQDVRLTLPAEVGGGAIGAAVEVIVGGAGGTMAGGPVGALATAALVRVGLEIRQRLLSPREEVRIATAVTIAGTIIDRRLKAGEQVRQDGFLSSSADGLRSEGEELVEGVLLLVQREYEERKIPYEANFIASLPFEFDVWAPEAHFLLRALQQMSYREIGVVSFIAQTERLGIPEPANPNDISDERNLRLPPELFRHEVENVHRLGLIEGGPVSLLALQNPKVLKLSRAGERLFRLAGLIDVPRQELEQFASWYRP